MRALVWALTALLVVCVVVLALEAWGRRATQSLSTPASATYPLRVVFGDRGTNDAAPYGANGSQSACTDETYDAQSGSWSCANWSIDTPGYPIEQADAYDGQCSERQVDQSTGRWVCVRS